MTMCQEDSLQLKTFCPVSYTHLDVYKRQVVNRLVEEYGKDHKKEITDATILEKISEANNQKVHIAKSKSGIVVTLSVSNSLLSLKMEQMI